MSTIGLILLLLFGYRLFGPVGAISAYIVVLAAAVAVLMNTNGNF